MTVCAAGQVYESHEGKLEKVGVAVRRGRMIKCRFCGHRGATLGCHIRSCRTSFHLPCARYNGSRLDVRPLASLPIGYLPRTSPSTGFHCSGCPNLQGSCLLIRA